MKFSPLSRALLLIAAFLPMSVRALAEEAKPLKDDKPGDFYVIPEDGRPWRHKETKLRFPQHLGEFVINQVFRDKRPEAGTVLSYVLPKTDVKSEIVIFPHSGEQLTPNTVVKVVHSAHQKLVTDLLTAASILGYGERDRSPAADSEIPLWDKGEIPFTSQTLDLAPLNKQEAAAKPPINQWIGLTIYQDYFVQITVSMPADKTEQHRKTVDAFITAVLGCIREPSIVPELLKLCSTYVNKPTEKEGRDAADALLTISKDSQVFAIPLPGEALTPIFNEIDSKSPETALDLLRAFVVGSAVVALQGGTPDDSFTEGTRMLLGTRELLQKDKSPINAKGLDELAAAAKDGKAADYIKARLKGAPPKQ